MILKDLADGQSVFVDANILVYHFAPHPQFGPSCNDFIRRIENKALTRLHLYIRPKRHGSSFDDLRGLGQIRMDK
jgi:hypothetical protein